jgi:hypothetical protein
MRFLGVLFGSCQPVGLNLRCAAILLGAAVIGRGAEKSNLFQVEATQENTAWTALYKGQKVMVYCFDSQKFKPYVKELYTLKGDNILRDAPADHLHHHGLMYAIKINGINFWEEVSGNGVEKVIQTEMPLCSSINIAGKARPQAKLSQVIHWVAPQDAFLPGSATALLIEHRTLTLTLDPAELEVALEWKSQFEVGSRTNTVTLTGANYHGLGLRFVQDFDPLAAHSLAGVHPDLANNRQDVSAAPGPPFPLMHQAGRHVSHWQAIPPTHGATTFFSMLTPFSYLSATQALDKERLVYHTGEKFELRYLVLLYSKLESQEFIERRVKAWKEQSG